MAEPITEIKRLTVSGTKQRERDLLDIEKALCKHKTAVIEAIEVLQGLHDRGLLSLVKGLLSEGDQVLAIVVNELNKPQNSQALQRVIQLATLIGSLDIDRLKPLVNGINTGLEAAATETSEKTGLLELWKLLKDPEVSRSIAILFTFLKGMSRSL